MSDKLKNQPENADTPDDEQEIDSSAVGVGAETDAEGGSPTPEEKLEQIAAEHDVSIDRDPHDAQANAEGSTSDKNRDITGGDTKEEDDDSTEPPD